MAQTQLTFARCAQALEQAGLGYGVLTLANGVRLVISERGGRIFGPFVDEQTLGLFWVNPVLGDEAAFSRFLAAGEWNLGGERIWIAPEIQYLVADRRDFWGTISVPVQMDPGSWTLQGGAAGGALLWAHGLS
jgi:hypothetical protein